MERLRANVREAQRGWYCCAVGEALLTHVGVTTEEIAEVGSALSSRFGDRVCAGASAIEPLLAELFPEEVASIARAIVKRQNEFASGRVLVRRLLGELDIPAVPIPAAPDRAPSWPRGIVGSISHTRTVCVAAIARDTDARSLGIDVEERAPIGPDLVGLVLTERERAWLARRAADETERLILAKLFFSAKECTYKCWYPLRKEVLAFEEADLDLDLGGSRFEAVVRGRERFSGFFFLTDHWIVTGMRFGG